MINLQGLAGNKFDVTTGVPTAPTAEELSAQKKEEQRKNNYFSRQYAATYLNKIIDDFLEEINKTELRRRIRYITVDRDELVRQGKLRPDQTLIPIRLTDTNIRREIPAYVQYVKGSRRLATFTSLEGNADTQTIEKEFTKGMTYDSWELPLFKVLDGSMTHGWDWIEVEANDSRPLKVGFYHIGHDRLLFDRGAHDIQKCDRILIKYDLPITTLESYVKDFSFNAKEVETLRGDNSGNTDANSGTNPLKTVYKVMFKYDGVVWVAWYSRETQDWLKNPVKLDLGVKVQQNKVVTTIDPMSGLPIPQTVPEWVSVDEKDYPIEILHYSETEAPRIIDHIGRVDTDKYKQEGCTALWSNLVNGANRSSMTFAAMRNSSGSLSAKISDTTIEGDRIYNEPIDFFSHPAPDRILLDAAHALDIQNSSETSKPSAAVTNRKDSEKTATELTLAKEEDAVLSSVQVMNFSTFLRRCYTRAWRITQSLALQGVIPFMRVTDPITGQPTVSPVVRGRYEIRAAGDIDVIQRQEKLQQLEKFFALTAGTPLQYYMLRDMILTAFPEDGTAYLQAMDMWLQQQSSPAGVSAAAPGMNGQQQEQQQNNTQQ